MLSLKYYHIYQVTVDFIAIHIMNCFAWCLEKRKWLRSISSASTRSFAPSESLRFWLEKSPDGSTCRASFRRSTLLEWYCPNLWAHAGGSDGVTLHILYAHILLCSALTVCCFSVQVLASLFEPTKTHRGEVLPPEQEHDYAAYHEIVPPAWGQWKQNLCCKVHS